MIFGIEVAIAQMQAYAHEQQQLSKLRKALPPEEFAKIMKARKKARKKEAKHQRKLAIAREGRSLNFWGNR